jgi:hypothetical protein
MEKDVAGLPGTEQLALDDGVVVCHTFLQQVIMWGEVAVHEAYGAAIYTQSNGHCSLVSLWTETMHITTISSHQQTIHLTKRHQIYII